MTASQIIMAAVGAAVAALGYVLAQYGKRGDQQIQQNKDQFQRLMDEANYWRDQTGEARAEFEGRWDRQIARCRKVTDQAYATIAELIRFVPDPQRQKGDRVLDEIAQHQDTETPEK